MRGRSIFSGAQVDLMTFNGCTVAIHLGQGQVVEFDVALDDRGRAVVSSVLMHALVLRMFSIWTERCQNSCLIDWLPPFISQEHSINNIQKHPQNVAHATTWNTGPQSTPLVANRWTISPRVHLAPLHFESELWTLQFMKVNSGQIG